MMTPNSSKRDFLSLTDFTRKEIGDILLLAQRLKKNPHNQTLKNKTVGLIFQKPSTRTAVSFAVGVTQMGGHPFILNADILQLKRGESPRDTGRVLSRYLDMVVIRANRHDDVVEMARHATIPVINGLTEKGHPCQIMADLLTIMEHRRIRNIKGLQSIQVAYLGDGNNVSQTWILAAGLLGFTIKLACPKGFEPDRRVLRKARQLIRRHKGGSIEVTPDPKKAVRGAHVVYTDVWASMGQEAESKKRIKVLAPYQVNRRLLRIAQKKALVMHCLPAHRGQEITDEVIEGKQSVVFDEAENRLHAQKAIMATLMKKRGRA